MKKLENILFTLILILGVLVVYKNIDTISEYANKYIFKNKTITISDSNIYKRNYEYIVFRDNNNFIPYTKDDIIDIYYKILNNGWEEFSFYCPDEYTNCLNDVEDIAKNNTLLSKINGYVNPYNSFESMDTTFSDLGDVKVTVTHKYDSDKINKVNEKIVEVINQLDLDNKDDIEKIKLIHNYIIDNVSYDKEGADNLNSIYDSSSSYGALIEGYGICSGYSDTMALFLDILKIPNLRISSDNHIWNLVKVDNNWLHLDLTWDDVENPKYKDNYFLVSTPDLLKLDKNEHNFDNKFFLEA